VGNQFLEILGGEVWACHQDLRHIGNEADRLEITTGSNGTISHRAQARSPGPHASAAPCSRRVLPLPTIGADDATCTNGIFDHDRLLQRCTHGSAEQACDDVAGSAGGERQDEGDRPARILCAAAPSSFEELQFGFLSAWQPFREVLIGAGAGCSLRARFFLRR
jgi:hypothetical protein